MESPAFFAGRARRKACKGRNRGHETTGPSFDSRRDLVVRSYQSRVLPWVAITLLLQSHTWGQRREVFRARLTAVPVDTVTARTTTGLGSLTATLEGGTLTFHGTFDSMNSRATAAHVHRAPKGLRGPNIMLSKDRKSTRLNSSHVAISYAVFCLKKKKNITESN